MSDRAAMIDFTAMDYASLREAMLALARERLPAWTDHTPNDLGVLLVELFASAADMVLYHQDRVASESFLETAAERRSVVQLLRLIGYELRPAVPATANLTLLFAADATDPVAVATHATFSTTAEATGEKVRFTYLGVSQTLDPSALPANYVHTDGKTYKRWPETLPVRQVDRLVQSEILGSSDGGAGQRFAVAGAPVVPGSLVLRVDEGGGPVAWTQVDNFLESRADDRHFVLRRDADGRATVELGDGVYGKVPRRGRNNLTADYQVGGGARGNVPPDTITKVVAGPDAVVTNLAAASGGADAEATEEAALRGPALFRAMGRAVTAADYEAHAKRLGVAKARARAPGWNRVELYVAPAGGGVPSDLLVQELLAMFEAKRVMGTEVCILPPRYAPVTVAIALGVEPYYFADHVEQAVRDAVTALLAFDAVDFEDVLYLSKIYETIEAVEGVASVFVSGLAREGDSDAIATDGRLEFGWDEIPRLDRITITTTGGQVRG